MSIQVEGLGLHCPHPSMCSPPPGKSQDFYGAFITQALWIINSIPSFPPRRRIVRGMKIPTSHHGLAGDQPHPGATRVASLEKDPLSLGNYNSFRTGNQTSDLLVLGDRSATEQGSFSLEPKSPPEESSFRTSATPCASKEEILPRLLRPLPSIAPVLAPGGADEEPGTAASARSSFRGSRGRRTRGSRSQDLGFSAENQEETSASSWWRIAMTVSQKEVIPSMSL